MANVNKLKIGTEDPDAILFDKPNNVEKESLFTWYKYASDAGGYFVRGLSILPWNTYTYWWPWDLNIPGGALKDVNGGAHYWGYVNNGVCKNLTSFMTEKFPANSWNTNNWGLSVNLFCITTPNHVENEVEWIKFPEPITITFLDDRFDDIIWSIKNEADVTISDDKRTITIRKIKVNKNEVLVGQFTDKTIDNIRAKMHNIMANVYGLTEASKDGLLIANPGSIECWDIKDNLGNAIYHKDKTYDNYVKKYAKPVVVNVGTIEEPNYKDEIAQTSFGLTEENKENVRCVLDDIVDYDKYFPKNDEVDITSQTGKHFTRINSVLTPESIATYISHIPDIVYVDENDPNPPDGLTTSDNNYLLIRGWLHYFTHRGELKLNFKGNYLFVSIDSIANNISVEKITLDLIGYTSISSFHNAFRYCNIAELNITRNGEAIGSNNKLNVADFSGMLERTTGPLIVPNVFSFKAQHYSNIYEKPVVDLSWMCSYNRGIREFAPGSTARILCGGLKQAFEYCTILKTIGPTINISCLKATHINNEVNNVLLRAFADCVNLEEVYILGINGDYINFNSNSEFGKIPKLKQECIEYLIYNATDLTNYDERITIRKPEVTFNMWTISGNSNARVGSVNKLILNDCPTGECAYFTADHEGYVEFIVDAKQPFDVIDIRKNDIFVTSDLTSSHRVDFVAKDKISIYMTRTSTIGEKDEIKLASYFRANAPKAAAGQIHCPAEWDTRITQEMIAEANRKNWTIYVNGTIKTEETIV